MCCSSDEHQNPLLKPLLLFSQKTTPAGSGLLFSQSDEEFQSFQKHHQSHCCSPPDYPALPSTSRLWRGW